jgi:hypothetical protein
MHEKGKVKQLASALAHVTHQQVVRAGDREYYDAETGAMNETLPESARETGTAR